MTLDITLACYEYEWTKPLWTRAVKPQGIDLTSVDYPNPERFTRMVIHDEFDACELSMGTYLATRSASEDYPFTALPIFPFRKFRHSYMFKREGAGIEDPTNLEGRRVGIVNWQTTTGIWQRGILREHHGVDTEEIHWHAGGSEIIDVEPANEYTLSYVEESGRPLHIFEDMMKRGDLDATFYPVSLDPSIATRLFPHPIAVETAYYRETGIFPVMHTIVVRDELLEANPWIAQKLYDAFEEAKRRALKRLDRPRWSPIVWSDIHVERQRGLLGEDPWEYGLTDGNVTAIEKLLEYADQQGITAERLRGEDLFATEHLNTGWYG